MKITLLQTDIAWGDRQGNLQNVEDMLDRHPGADLYVLPEMFATGFCVGPEDMAEPTDGLSLLKMKEWAGRYDCAIAGSLCVKDGGVFRNRFCFVHPDGRTEGYDKRHLFTPGGENRQYVAGNRRVVVRFRGWRILLQVCYDLRFPVWSRNRGDYDMVLYVASWPEARREVWNTLLRARAIENQCYVAGVNRVGSDPYCRYDGGTMLIDAYGRDVAAVPDGRQDAVTAEIGREALERFRAKFPVLDDGDDFYLRG